MPTSDNANSSTGRLNESFRKAVEGFSVDIPTIMHGSGDVDPSAANDETVQLVASLTAEYVSKLVDSAIDSHKILASGSGRQSSALDAPLPPRKRSRIPPKPAAPDIMKVAKEKRKTVRGLDEYWDQPLPEPKIRGADKQRSSRKVLHIDEWVGLAGIELREDQIRTSYVRGTEAIATPSFIFPVCHDVYAYGRVRAAQAAKRASHSILVHQPLLEMIQEDHNENQSEKKTVKEDASDPEDEDNDDEKDSDEGKIKENDDDETGPSWPGIDGILPIPRA